MAANSRVEYFPYSCLTSSIQVMDMLVNTGIMPGYSAVIGPVLKLIDLYPSDHLASLPENTLFPSSMRFIKNSNQDKCVAHLCTLGNTCLGSWA